MKNILLTTGSVLSILFAPALATASTAANGYTARTPLPIDNWAVRDIISDVEISPDGKHILVMKIESKEGENVLEIYSTDDMTKPLRRLNADPMEFISANWVTDNIIYGTAWQVVRKRVDGPEEDVREYKSYAYNLDTNKFSEDKGASSIVNVLPNEPNSVLIAAGRDNSSTQGVDPFAAFRARSYYRFNLKTGAKTLVIKGTRKYANVSFDLDGNPRYASGLDGDYVVEYYRRPGETSWNEFNRYNQDDHANLFKMLSGYQRFQGVDQKNPNRGYIIEARNGDDKAALWEFDFTTGKFGEKLFEAPNSDVIGVQTSSNFWAGDGKVVAAIYPDAKRERHWFDEKEKDLYDKISASIENAHAVSISSRSRDGKKMIVRNSGPHDPGSYYYINGNQMMALGSRNPLVKASDLADVEFVRYTSRDGKSIPGYITKPKGEGPFPTIILPHGGPHVNEVIGYDEWGQLLANNGYLVFQPQYRMSTGWGRDHFDSAYGQHGLAMQDDKDDGAQYLIDRGLSDPDRMAMFGWSYGGYAALVAASRTPQMYQCVIAGAAVADPAKVYRKRSNPWSPKALDDWSQRRGMIGINPINEVAEVNIPVMMVHGDFDARVLYFNYKDYRTETEKVAETRDKGTCKGGTNDSECIVTRYQQRRKNEDSVVQTASGSGDAAYQAKSRFVTLKGADHFYTTLMYDHQKKFYTEMLDFLQKDCGPGGL
ncbi:MAG: alpha/beta hydrolase family protein [Alphaproteobacteria bacterium]